MLRNYHTEFLTATIYNWQSLLKDDDYKQILNNSFQWLVKNKKCTINAFVIMPNHFHFLLNTDNRCSVQIKQGDLLIDPVTNGVRKLLSGYARIFNARYNQSSSLFRQIPSR